MATSIGARVGIGAPLTNDEKMKYSLAVMKAYVDLTPEQQLEMLRDSV